MEEEARAILRAAVDTETVRKTRLGTSIAACFAGIGLRDDEEIPELRGYAPKPATFDWLSFWAPASFPG